MVAGIAEAGTAVRSNSASILVAKQQYIRLLNVAYNVATVTTTDTRNARNRENNICHFCTMHSGLASGNEKLQWTIWPTSPLAPVEV